jgi:catechol 2,3-dioxygenase-like lactoylglutathione lyase family enzyme
MLTRFDHLTIAVNDLDGACSSYAALLGTPPSWRGTHPEIGTQTALFGVGNALIELVAPLPNSEAAEGLCAWLAAHGEGLQAVAFGTDDAEACSSQLRQRGIRCTPPSAGVAHAADGTLRDYKVIELSPKTSRGLHVLVVERADASQLMAAERTATRLDHFVIRTADADAAQALYGAGLGIRLALDRLVEQQRMLFFRVGGVTLEVIVDPAGGAQDVFYGAAYRVPDAEAARARVAAAGIAVSDVRAGRKPDTLVFHTRESVCGVPTLVLRDPSRDQR